MGARPIGRRIESTPVMTFYHRTRPAAAAAILKHGFRNGSGSYMTARRWRGVWLSDRPDATVPDGAPDVLFALTIPVAAIRQYEWVTEGNTYREFLVPAAVVNEYGPPRVVKREPNSRVLVEPPPTA